MTNSINRFGQGIKNGDSYNAELLGGKGAALAEMGALGLPVPPGVTISTEVCNNYLTKNIDMDNLVDDVLNHFEDIAHDLGYMPLVSVRSGARVSMPGMMDTVLNVGISGENFEKWVKRIGYDAAADCYTRLITMYSETVLGIPAVVFADATTYTDMLATFKDLTGEEFPQAIEEQLAGAIEAVFNSWNSERAIAYRAMHGYPDHWGTAVNVQQMVFGNANNKSCSGVMFTRDFNTGDAETIIDWLPNAQGEDVVAGTHTPNTKVDLIHWDQKVYDELGGIAAQLETHYNDMQDIEFTVDSGKLYILQTRNGKRSALAAFKIAHDFEAAGKIDKAEMLRRITAKQYIALHNPSIDPSYKEAPDFTGTGASGSIATGIAVLNSADAVSCKEDCILVTEETTPNDFPGMAASVGIVTRTGGITSHAAVVARGMDRTCVVGAENLKFGGLEGKQITIDGATGRVWVGKDVPVIEGNIPAFVEDMVDLALADDDSFFAVAPESVPNGSTVFVDVSGSLITQTTLSKALDALKASKSNGILSFGRNNAPNDDDSHFLGFFGVNPNTMSEAEFAVIAKVLSMGKWTKTFKKNWTLYLPSGTGVEVANTLRDQGWKVVTVVNSFKAALSVDGYVVMDAAFTEQLSRENMTFGEIEKLVTEAGREVKELPTPVTKARRLFDVLGG